MEPTNPYENNQQVPWVPQQGQRYDGAYNSQPYVPYAGQRQNQEYQKYQRPQQAPAQQNQPLTHKSAQQKPRQPEKMSKARALALAGTLKRWLVVASFVGFGTFSGLAAFHQVSSTTTSSHSSSSSSQNSSSSSSTSGSSLNQSGSNNFGSSSSSSTSSGTSVS
jgi:hypothetical protein